MKSGVRQTTAQSLVDSVLQLISLPEIYLRLQQVIDDPNHSREQVAGVIVYDPALSARILRIANSSYYGFPRRIETVAEAVGVIGELDLRNLVLATTVVASMDALQHEGVDIDEFWLHSLRCALTARLLAASLGGCNPEQLFLAGILHDLGILVIYQHDAALSMALARHIGETHQLRDQAEREVLGFDHAEVGALLIEAWRLSPELVELARCHHQYQLAQQQPRAVQMLALANLLAGEESPEQTEPDIRVAPLIAHLELSPGKLCEIRETSDIQCAEVRNIILG